MAEALGAVVDIRFDDSAAWMPVSRVPYPNGEVGVFPHLLDRYKPGVIGVLQDGRRFTNESKFVPRRRRRDDARLRGPQGHGDVAGL
jgi:hypothetical protein